MRVRKCLSDCLTVWLAVSWCVCSVLVKDSERQPLAERMLSFLRCRRYFSPVPCGAHTAAMPTINMSTHRSSRNVFQMSL